MDVSLSHLHYISPTLIGFYRLSTRSYHIFKAVIDDSSSYFALNDYATYDFSTFLSEDLVILDCLCLGDFYLALLTANSQILIVFRTHLDYCNNNQYKLPIDDTFISNPTYLFQKNFNNPGDSVLTVLQLPHPSVLLSS
jgi:hypothetical protein